MYVLKRIIIQPGDNAATAANAATDANASDNASDNASSMEKQIDKFIELYDISISNNYDITIFKRNEMN